MDTILKNLSQWLNYVKHMKPYGPYQVNIVQRKEDTKCRNLRNHEAKIQEWDKK